MTFDVGTNLFSLGLLFLLFKFVLPIVIGLILLAGAYFGFKYFTSGIFPINVNQNWLIVIVCVVLILLVIMAAG